MGFLDSMKANQIGTKAYRLHAAAMQLRRSHKYEESEAKLDEAIRLYGEAYKLGFRKTNAMQGYAILLMRRGEFERAREIMLECSKDKNMSQDDRFTLRIDFAICQWKLGKLDKAIETLNSAAQAKKNGTLYTTLGMLLVEKARQTGDYEAALQLNQEAYEYDDEDAGVLDNMGQLALLMSDRARSEGDDDQAAEQRAKALEYFKKAYEIKPEQISSTYYLAKMYHENGMDDKARGLIDEILKISVSAIMQVNKEDVLALQRELK